jgi:hypothetical protein
LPLLASQTYVSFLASRFLFSFICRTNFHLKNLIVARYAILQLVRSNIRRFMPSQADEEAHQLSYLQKHMANILTLLADSVDGEGDDSMVSFFFFFISSIYLSVFIILLLSIDVISVTKLIAYCSV